MKATVQYANINHPDPTCGYTGPAIAASFAPNASQSSANPARPTRCVRHPASGTIPGRSLVNFTASSCAGQLPLPPSTRIGVTSSNRALLRYLRKAELEAWEEGLKTPPNSAAQERTALEWSTVPAALRSSWSERCLYGLLILASLPAAAWAVLDSAGLMNRWSEFVQFVQRLVG